MRPTIYRGTTVRVYSRSFPEIRGEQGVVTKIVNVRDVLTDEPMRLYYVTLTNRNIEPVGLLLRELVKDVEN